MAKLTKKQKEAVSKIEKNKLYNLKDASALIKLVASAKFDESVDIAVRLGVDPRKANQMVRGVVTLPHGTGKDTKVFLATTRKIRKAIVQELASGTAIEDITVDIVGQYNGDLQLDGVTEETMTENLISHLFDFRGDVKNIKTNDIYIVDQNKALVRLICLTVNL